MKKQVKTVALIAHDNKKHDMINWCIANKKKLEKFSLCGTGTTAGLITEATKLTVKKFLSGPLGGDLQIGGKIAEGKVDMVVFFWDPLTSQPHDPDVKALLRIAALADIPIATNKATADDILNCRILEIEE